MTSPTSSAPGFTDRQRQEAAEWFIQINEGKEPEAEALQAWLRWMEGDAGNRLAFEAILEVWQMGHEPMAAPFPTAQELAADSYDGTQSVRDWNASRGNVSPRSAPERRPSALDSGRVDRRRWRLAAVASIAAASVLIALVWSKMIHTPALEYQTNIGQQLQVVLPDGSRVWLGAKSRLVVNFTREQRGVSLETGEAYFSVMKDHTRPFTVRSLHGVITAVGTAFDVRAVADRVTIAVTEGVVIVHPTVQPTGQTTVADARVDSGQELTIDRHRPITTLSIVRTANPGERLRWRDGVLVYSNEPLRVVVADLARYTDRHLEIAGDDIGELRFSGTVDRNAVDEWAQALVESFPVRLINDHDRLTIVPR